MKQDFSEALEGLIQAIGNEEDGIRFYRQAEESVRDERGKALYRSLISEEEVHLRILETEYDRLKNNGTWVPLSEAKKGERKLVLFPDERSSALIFTPGMSDLDALRLAMDFEHKGYELYEKAAREATDAAARGSVVTWPRRKAAILISSRRATTT